MNAHDCLFWNGGYSKLFFRIWVVGHETSVAVDDDIIESNHRRAVEVTEHEVNQLDFVPIRIAPPLSLSCLPIERQVVVPAYHVSMTGEKADALNPESRLPVLDVDVPLDPVVTNHCFKSLVEHEVPVG